MDRGIECASAGCSQLPEFKVVFPSASGPWQSFEGATVPWARHFSLHGLPFPRLWNTILSNSYWSEPSQGRPQAMSCSHLASTGLQHFQPQCLVCILWLEPKLAYFPGCMEGRARISPWPERMPGLRLPQPEEGSGPLKSRVQVSLSTTGLGPGNRICPC